MLDFVIFKSTLIWRKVDGKVWLVAFSIPIDVVVGGFNQLMVNWWFGLVVWIPRIPLWKGLLLGGTLRIPNHLAPNQQLTISWFNLRKNPSKFGSSTPAESDTKSRNQKLDYRLVHVGVTTKDKSTGYMFIPEIFTWNTTAMEVWKMIFLYKGLIF